MGGPSLHPPLYGIDIETDTTAGGLDPRVAAVVAVAIADDDGERVYDGGPGREADVLAAVDADLARRPPGVLVTWNGAAFDLPFLADRAARAGVELGLRLHLDPCLAGRRPPLAGHAGAYRGTWHGHRHLDAYRLYRADVGPALRVSCGLKSIARLVGLDVVEADGSSVHTLAAAELRAYVASDARATRQLALRRWPGAALAVDAPLTPPARATAAAGAPSCRR